VRPREVQAVHDRAVKLVQLGAGLLAPHDVPASAAGVRVRGCPGQWQIGRLCVCVCMCVHARLRVAGQWACRCRCFGILSLWYSIVGPTSARASHPYCPFPCLNRCRWCLCNPPRTQSFLPPLPHLRWKSRRSSALLSPAVSAIAALGFRLVSPVQRSMGRGRWQVGVSVGG